MLRRANGRVDGFVIESPTAGGHNAPPRGKLQLNAAGEPVYGERDRVDIDDLRALGVPFWLAGGYGNPEKLREALEQGAAGVQVGTAFAFSRESGMRADLKRRLLGRPRRAPARYSPIRWLRLRDFPSRWRCLKAPLRRSTSTSSASASATWAICASRTRRRRQDRIPLLRGAGRKLPGQGRQDRGYRRPQMPVQCAAGQYRPRQTRKDDGLSRRWSRWATI